MKGGFDQYVCVECQSIIIRLGYEVFTAHEDRQSIAIGLSKERRPRRNVSEPLSCKSAKESARPTRELAINNL